MRALTGDHLREYAAWSCKSHEVAAWTNEVKLARGWRLVPVAGKVSESGEGRLVVCSDEGSVRVVKLHESR